MTMNGRGDTVLLGISDYEQMKSILKLLRTLSEAEDDVRNGRVASIEDTLDGIRASLLERNKE